MTSGNKVVPSNGSVAVTAADRAYIQMREDIVGGVYEPGQPLREEEVASATGVSRTPVREALRRLDAEGLVELLPNRGARVASWSPHDLDEIFELRVLLESYGARLAAANITDEELGELAQLCDRMEAEVGRGRMVRFQQLTDLNNQIHQAILNGSGNHRLSPVLGSFVQRSLVARTFHLYNPDQLQRSCSGHRELLEALTAHDADWAEATMRAHLYAGRQTAKGSR